MSGEKKNGKSEELHTAKAKAQEVKCDAERGSNDDGMCLSCGEKH